MASLKDRYVDDHVYCVLSEYEKVLLGNKKKFSVPKTVDKKDKIDDLAALWWSYAIKDICHWDYDQAVAFVDSEFVKQMRLEPSFQHIPPDKRPHVSKNMNYDFAVALVYPKEAKYSAAKRAIDEYERVNHLGKYVNDPNDYSYSKGFWNKPENTALCLGYCIQNFLSYKSQYELYKFFASPDALKFIKDHNLLDAFRKSICETPLELFHKSLDYSARDEFLYHMVKRESELSTDK